MRDVSSIRLDRSDLRQAGETPAGLRTVLRALVGRLGTADTGFELGSGAIPATFSLGGIEYGREGVPPLDRFARSTAWETGREDAADAGQIDEPPALPSRATAAANRLARLRANAHAAYASVHGRPEAALDAALAVLEAELRAVADRADAHAEILKQVRLYARDADSRALATRGLEASAEVLADCQLVAAGCTLDQSHPD